jgi:hypothetical protein
MQNLKLESPNSEFQIAVPLRTKLRMRNGTQSFTKLRIKIRNYVALATLILVINPLQATDKISDHQHVVCGTSDT